MNRREFLRNSGLAASIAAIAAACGDTTGPTSPGRLGVAEPQETLPSAEVNDIVLLRTAQSLHHTAVDVHTRLLASDDLPSELNAPLEQMIANHEASAGEIDSLVAAAGGVGFACANPFWTERFVDPAFAAIDGSDGVDRDLLNIAHAFEEIIARSHQALVSVLDSPASRHAILAIGLEGTRQAAYLAAMVSNDYMVEPGMLGGDPFDADDDGFPVRYVIPDEFGQVGGIVLTVGAIDPNEATRFSVSLQTPADNSFAYEYLACS